MFGYIKYTVSFIKFKERFISYQKSTLHHLCSGTSVSEIPTALEEDPTGNLMKCMDSVCRKRTLT